MLVFLRRDTNKSFSKVTGGTEKLGMDWRDQIPTVYKDSRPMLLKLRNFNNIGLEHTDALDSAGCL